MSVKYFVLLFICLLFAACCRNNSTEAGRFELPDPVGELLPYAYGQEIPFQHSNGYNFSFHVIESSLEWEEYHDECEWVPCCEPEYYSYQKKRVRLESDYPVFAIEFTLGEPEYFGAEPTLLRMNFNHRYSLSIPYDSTGHFLYDSTLHAICMDTIRINDQYYFQVLRKTFDNYDRSEDNTLLVPKAILYNKLGLLQIIMSNDETYSITD